MSEFLNYMKGAYTELPDELDLFEDVGVGLVDVSIGALLLAPDNLHDLPLNVVEYALVKPAGLALGIFGVLCLKAAAQKTYNRLHA